jgi:hypothetical protein
LIAEFHEVAVDAAAPYVAALYTAKLDLDPAAVADQAARARCHDASHFDITGDWYHVHEQRMAKRSPEQAIQANLLRCLAGNPFSALGAHPGWPGWAEVVLARLAEAISESQDFDRMPSLGWVIEKTGCSNRGAIDHCRQPAPHHPDCWVLASLLGRSDNLCVRG